MRSNGQYPKREDFGIARQAAFDLWYRGPQQPWCCFQNGRVLQRHILNIVLDAVTIIDPGDVIAGQFDAGIQIGESIQHDMIAVRVSKELRFAVVGSPEYFKSHEVPRTPRDLNNHPCIGIRCRCWPYRWESEKGRKAQTVSIQGPAVFDDTSLIIQAV